jgi:hypothetical protein
MKKPLLQNWDWKADGNRGCKDIYAGENKIAVCFTTGCHNEVQDQRNAKMIVASPKMAIALENIFKTTSGKVKRMAKEALQEAGYKF